MIKSKTLSKRYHLFVFLSALSFFICGLSFIMFIVSMIRFNLSAKIVFIIVFFLSGIFGTILRRQSAILKSGIDGEKSVEKIISKLPKSYIGYKNLKINYGRQTSELDMVVVGPTGVFIIETKNIRGRISGSYEHTHLFQRKVGKGGNVYTSKFYSPIKQVGTHTYRLAHILKNNGVNLRVNPIVYFSNLDATVNIQGKGTVAIFSATNTGSFELLKFITKHKMCVTPKDFQLLTMLLNKL